MTRRRLAGELTIRAGTARAITVGTLAETLWVVSLALDMTWRSVTLELASLPLFANAVALVAIAVALAANEREKAEQNNEHDAEGAFHHGRRS